MEPRELVIDLLARKIEEESLPDILSAAFPKQLEFILHPAKQKTLFCTRRSAKTYTAGLYLIHEALRNPGCNCIFIALTRDSAKAIVWKDVLKEIDHKFSLGIRFNETELTATLPNGAVIYVKGADSDEKEMMKLLGRKFRLACIDEASMYTINMRNLIYGVLKPAVTDANKDGESGIICLMGTASDFPQGLFYDITTGKENGWKLFEWTAYDNPHMVDQWIKLIDNITLERPLYMDTPQYKQWYLNHWVIDDEKLCYRFSPTRNLIKEIPKFPHDGWVRVLGVDTGWEDDNAFVLTAYHVNDPNLYVLKVFKRKRLTFDQVIEVINEFMKDDLLAPHKVFIDGANKQGVESMRLRSNIPFEYADKKDKVTFIELCNGDLVQGKIRVHDTPINRPLWEEMSSLVWLTDGERIKLPKKEHPNLPNHLCDAFLYAWRNGYHYHATPVEQKIVMGSRDWYIKQNSQIWEKERERLDSGNGRNDWSEQPEFNISDIFRRYTQ